MLNSASSRRAWVNLLALCLIMSGSVGILANVTGVVFNAILADLNFRSGDLSAYYTIRQLAGSAAVLFTPRFLRRGTGHRYVAVVCIVQSLAFGAFSVCGKVWHWYILALFTSFSQGTMHTICAIIIANWFRRRAGLAIGIAMSFSGIAGVVSNLAVSQLILSLGWRAAVLYMMGASLILTVPPSLLLLRSTPEELGLEPFGALSAQTQERSAPLSVAIPDALRQRGLRLSVIFTIGVGVCMSLTNQLALFGQSLGLSLTAAAYMQSCSMCGNLGGKLLIGALADRLGAFRTMRLGVVLILGALGGFLLFPGSEAMLYLCSMLLGFAYAVYATQSIVYQNVFGPSDYKRVLTRMMALCGLANALYSLLAGYFYDFLGSFRLTYSLAAVLCVAQVLTLRRLRRLRAAIDTSPHNI